MGSNEAQTSSTGSVLVVVALSFTKVGDRFVKLEFAFEVLVVVVVVVVVFVVVVVVVEGLTAADDD